MTNYSSVIEKIIRGRCALFLGAGSVASSMLKTGSSSPIGNKLAEMLYKRFYGNSDYEGESLQQVTSMIEKSDGTVALHDSLNDIFDEIKPSPGFLKIPLFKWSNIYTTNIDQAVEIAYEQVDDKAQNLKVVVGPLDLASVDRHTEVTLYKLHGCISRKDVPLVFSLEQYAKSKEDHLKLFNSLSTDLIDNSVVFVGYSMLDSNFQSVWSTIKQYCATTKMVNHYYYVAPNIKLPFRQYLESEGFTIFNVTGDEFFNNLLIETHGERKTLNDYYSENIKPISFFSKPELTGRFKYKISSNFEFPKLEVSFPHPKTTSFYKGNEPNWADIKHDLDAKRELGSTLLANLDEWIKNPITDLWLVTGRAGDGKSTILKRLAYEASLRLDESVIFAKPKADLDPEDIIEMVKILNRPVILFLDNTTDRIPKINNLFRFILGAKVKILLIGAARISDWTLAKKDFYLKPNEFRLEKLSDEEILSILSVLKINSSLNQLVHLTPKEQFQFFKDESERELIVALKEATYQKKFEEIIANEYAEIKSESAKRAYLHICLVNQFRYRFPQSLLLRILGLNYADIYNAIFKFTEEIVYIDDSPDNSDYLLRARHSVIAQTVVDYFLKSDVDKFQILEELLDKHIPSHPIESSLVKKLYHHSTVRKLFSDNETGLRCYELLESQVPGNHFILQQKSIFLTDYIRDYRAAKQSITKALGLNDSPTLQNTEGTIYLKEAIDEQDYDKSKYLLEKGKRMLLSIAKRTRGNNSYHYHSLVNHMITWYQKFDSKESEVIQEIQSIIDEATRKHPNDHMLLTEKGKIDELLNKTESAIEYFSQAIELNERNATARTLLARALINQRKFQQAFDLCEEGLKLSYDNFQLNRTRFELAHRLRLDSAKLKKDYELVLSHTPKDDYLRLSYSAFLYIIADKNCEIGFRRLRKSHNIPIEEKPRPRFEMAKLLNRPHLIETGIVTSVFPGTIRLRTTRFRTSVETFMQRRKELGSVRVGDRIKYEYTFSYLSPFAHKVL